MPVTEEKQKGEKNFELIKKAQNGDKEALETLISENIGLVKNIARRFFGRGTEYEDIVQIGTIGMIKAAKSFDESYNTVFSTYAVPLIIGEIRRYFRDDGMIKVSRDIRKKALLSCAQKKNFKRNTNGIRRFQSLLKYALCRKKKSSTHSTRQAPFPPFKKA